MTLSELLKEFDKLPIDSAYTFVKVSPLLYFCACATKPSNSLGTPVDIEIVKSFIKKAYGEGRKEVLKEVDSFPEEKIVAELDPKGEHWGIIFEVMAKLRKQLKQLSKEEGK